MIFLFKQQTAYEMRISDWSSDVCSSDLEIPYHGCARSRQWPDEGLLRSVGDSQSHADRRPSAQHRHCRHLRATDNAYPKGTAKRVVRSDGRGRRRTATLADRKSTRLNSNNYCANRMPSSA